MNIVALDACGRYAMAALKRSDGAIVEAAVGGEGAVRSVYATVDRVLAEGALAPAALDAIVVNTGPGSWTGTRIAVTYTASLAFGAGVKVFGYSGFAIGKRLAGGVAFIDQLGKTVAENESEAPLTVNLFPEASAEDYLAQRRAWLHVMLQMGAEALTSGEAGDPLQLQTTYFQEFLTGARN
jgi:hypothetical protein